MVTKLPLAQLEQFPFFSGIPQQSLESLEQTISLRIRPPRSGIYFPGDAADNVFFLVEGRVKISTFSPDGREIIKRVVQPGEMFGEMVLVSGELERTDFATPLKMQATFVAVRTPELRVAIQHVPELANRFIDHLGKMVKWTESMVEDYVLFDSRARIIDFILDLDQTADSSKAYHYMTHQDIAGLTGASRQFVTSVMNELRKKKLIDFNRLSVQVKDRKGLEAQR
jgi:CRP/FNR family transcriptional regulator, cyclic AMP receptor protein